MSRVFVSRRLPSAQANFFHRTAWTYPLTAAHIFGQEKGGSGMQIPWELVAAFGLGLALLYWVGYLLVVPTRFVWRMMACGVLGGIALWVLNQLSGFTGITVAVNPFTALTLGALGVPGLGMIIALQFILGI